jgi:hypothetical protein
MQWHLTTSGNGFSEQLVDALHQKKIPENDHHVLQKLNYYKENSTLWDTTLCESQPDVLEATC